MNRSCDQKFVLKLTFRHLPEALFSEQPASNESLILAQSERWRRA
jgi:hypothetical protein